MPRPALDLPDARVEAHHGGMGSATWLVSHGGRRWVAKSVDGPLRAQFAGGLSVAALVDAAGIPAGAPVPALDGRSLVTVNAMPLALLTWVEGEPLTGVSVDEQRMVGATLALAHRTLQGASVPGAQRFHWVRPQAAHLAVRPWIRPAVTAAVAALDQLGLGSLTWGLLHADPAPEHFRLDARQWALWPDRLERRPGGPLLYDLASAVMYVGGPDHGTDLVEAYLRRPILTPAEVERALPVMLRFRWAVQADYFAWRIANHDLTGISGPAANEQAWTTPAAGSPRAER